MQDVRPIDPVESEMTRPGGDALLTTAEMSTVNEPEQLVWQAPAYDRVQQPEASCSYITRASAGAGDNFFRTARW